MDIILKKPVITEKSMKLAKEGLFTFLVDPKARKPQISKAVKDLFGVDIVSVKTANFKGESKRQRGRGDYIKTSGFKKAIIQLKKGQKIGLFEEEKKVEEEVASKVKEKKSLLRGTRVKIEKTDETEKKGQK